MLTSLFIFSLKASVVLGVLYLAYHVLFKQNTRFVVRRFLLLGIAVAALALPMMQVQTQMELWPQKPVIQQVDELPYLEQAEVIIDQKRFGDAPDLLHYGKEDVIRSFQRGQLNVVDMAALVYLTGMGLMLVLLLFELSRILILVALGPARHDLDKNTIAHRWVKAPFSFGKWIFIPLKTNYDEHTWQLVHSHERAHLRQAHSVDVLFSALLRCFMWFNPAAHLLHKEVKNNHESLADKSVLKKVDLVTYSEALLRVSLDTHSVSLGHAFALKSNLAKRIKVMQSHKTTLLKSFTALSLFLLVGLGIFTQTSLYSQNQTDRNELLKELKNKWNGFHFMANSKLSERHQIVFNKIRKEYPLDSLSWNYLSENTFAEFVAAYQPYKHPLYFDKLMGVDKEDIINQIEQDTSTLTINGAQFYSYEFREETREKVKAEKNYLLIYKKLTGESNLDNEQVFEMEEVDVLPEPIGGLDNFTKVIAMDCNIPAGIDRDRLPEFIEFEFVIHGARHYSASNLLTVLKGSDKKNEDLYRFFGEVHSMIRRKIGTAYVWKKGMKDGKPVSVRMVLSIPTKFM